jgi:hypothetical protein
MRRWELSAPEVCAAPRARRSLSSKTPPSITGNIQKMSREPLHVYNVVELNLTPNFSKVLIVKITQDFEVQGRMIPRKALPKTTGDRLKLKWSDFDVD